MDAVYENTTFCPKVREAKQKLEKQKAETIVKLQEVLNFHNCQSSLLLYYHHHSCHQHPAAKLRYICFPNPNDKPHQHCIHLCINGLFVPSKCVLKTTTISTTVAGRGNNQVSWAGCHGQAGAAGNLPGEPEWTLNNFKLIKMIIMFAEAFLTGKPFFAMQKKPWLLHFYVPDFVLTLVLRLESSRGDSDLAQNSAMMRYQREKTRKEGFWHCSKKCFLNIYRIKLICNQRDCTMYNVDGHHKWLQADDTLLTEQRNLLDLINKLEGGLGQVGCKSTSPFFIIIIITNKLMRVWGERESYGM